MPESTRIQVGRAVSQLRNDQAPEPVRGDPPATERAAGGHQDQQARSGPGTRQTAHSDALATCPPVRASIAVGIWFLLRVSELTALNVEDVCQRQGARLQAGPWINRSKTDQEEVGVLVSRDCVCEDPAAAPWCPAHLLWKVICSRKDMMHKMGTVSGKAPLFTDAEGKRLTASGVKKQCG